LNEARRGRDMRVSKVVFGGCGNLLGTKSPNSGIKQPDRRINTHKSLA
jgi:hypothetical protein